MKTIRPHVFETNSSSEHALSYYETPRDKSEFPLPDENGILEIEIKHFWECRVDYDPESVLDILDYLAAQAIFSCETYDYDESIKDWCIMGSFETNHDQFLNELKTVYEDMGLPEIKDIRIFATTLDGKKFYLDTNEDYYMERPWCEEELTEEQKKLPILPHIGISANDLLESSFLKAVGRIPKDYDRADRDKEYAKRWASCPKDVSSVQILLKTKSKLTFWHS